MQKVQEDQRDISEEEWKEILRVPAVREKLLLSGKFSGCRKKVDGTKFVYTKSDPFGKEMFWVLRKEPIDGEGGDYRSEVVYRENGKLRPIFDTNNFFKSKRNKSR